MMNRKWYEDAVVNGLMSQNAYPHFIAGYEAGHQDGYDEGYCEGLAEARFEAYLEAECGEEFPENSSKE